MLHHELDEIDIQILHLLQKDSRLTNKDIASMIGKSTSPVYERVKRLQDGGYIKQYVAILDNRLINKSLVAFTNVYLKAHAQEMMLGFEQEVIRFPEVMECFHLTGEYDFLLKIVVRDMDEYHDFIMKKLSKLSNVGTVQTYFVLKESKRNTAYQLELPSRKKRRARKAKTN